MLPDPLTNRCGRAVYCVIQPQAEIPSEITTHNASAPSVDRLQALVSLAFRRQISRLSHHQNPRLESTMWLMNFSGPAQFTYLAFRTSSSLRVTSLSPHTVYPAQRYPISGSLKTSLLKGRDQARDVRAASLPLLSERKMKRKANTSESHTPSMHAELGMRISVRSSSGSLGISRSSASARTANPLNWQCFSGPVVCSRQELDLGTCQISPSTDDGLPGYFSILGGKGNPVPSEGELQFADSHYA